MNNTIERQVTALEVSAIVDNVVSVSWYRLWSKSDTVLSGNIRDEWKYKKLAVIYFVAIRHDPKQRSRAIVQSNGPARS